MSRGLGDVYKRQILCSPIGENEFLRLIVNEIVGVTTLAALAREVRSSMKNEAGKVEM